MPHTFHFMVSDTLASAKSQILLQPPVTRPLQGFLQYATTAPASICLTKTGSLQPTITTSDDFTLEGVFPIPISIREAIMDRQVRSESRSDSPRKLPQVCGLEHAQPT